MLRLLIVTLGIRNHLNACPALSRRANALGHECLVASPNRSPSDEVARARFAFRHLTPPEGGMGPSPSANALQRLLGARARARQRGLAVLSGLGLEQAISETDPDLFIADAELHEYLLTAWLAKRAVASLDTHLSVRQHGNVPVQSSGYVPADSPWSRLRCALGWHKALLGRSLGRGVRRLLVWPWDKHTVMTRLARSHGEKLGPLIDTSQWQL